MPSCLVRALIVFIISILWIVSGSPSAFALEVQEHQLANGM